MCLSVRGTERGREIAMRKTALTEYLAPLADFYAAAGATLPHCEIIMGSEVPEPYRSLLVHERDMTSTLENFHKGQIHLRVLSSAQRGNLYRREVVLAVDGSDAPVEFGAIRIHLAALPPPTRAQVLEAKRPLGAILSECAVEYSSHPRAFFRIESDDVINRAMELSGTQDLFGRCNEIKNTSGHSIAEIVEILPPC